MNKVFFAFSFVHLNVFNLCSFNLDRFSRRRAGMHFHIFSDPFEITRYFESQIDNMMKSFGFGFGLDNGFGNDFHSFSGIYLFCAKFLYR